ncbi:uncharacterized protein LOC130934454 [Arachis stenosperma]|uniref:uncharacterized protein LOC130934454 n=1 Tax=Arachis stenosperma TaxID=217475 RepID=UPI0025ABE4CE|nr:uncharacterized protein LOC130934454 [Arachis stenosperma]
MHRKDRYTKKPKLGIGCQQPQTAPPLASASHRDDSHILPDSGDRFAGTSRPFLPPRSVPRPTTQTSTNNIQNSEPGHVNLAANANDVDSLDQEADDPLVDTSAQSRKGRKTTEFWAVKIIDSDGTIKSVKLIVREAMKRPNGRKIVLRFNNTKQAIGDETGLLNGVLVNEGTIKKNILKSMENAWKETRLRLYNDCYEPTFTIEQNIERRPPGIDREHWRWFLDYCAKAETKEKCRKNAINRSKQLYTHTGGSKSFARKMEKEEKIEEIEQHDESSRVLSQNDSIAQVFGKEKLGGVRGVSFGLTPS